MKRHIEMFHYVVIQSALFTVWHRDSFAHRPLHQLRKVTAIIN